MSNSESSSESESEDLLKEYPNSSSHQFSGVLVLIGTVASLVLYYCYVNVVAPDIISQATLVFLPTCLSFLTITAYVITRCTPPAPIPKRYWLNDQEHIVVQSYEKDGTECFTQYMELIANRRGIRERSSTGDAKICTRCDIVQPERAHHCNICDCCVLRLDKHSFFFGNCIHLRNKKASMLTMFYVCFNYTYMGITMIYVALSHVQQDLKMQRVELQVGLMFVAVLTCLTMASLSGLFLSMDLWHCLNNETYYEYENPPKFEKNLGDATYDTGSYMKNIEQQMGSRAAWWFLPIDDLKGDGTKFPLRKLEKSA